MLKNQNPLQLIFIFIIVCQSCTTNTPSYFNQILPNNTPILFAPDVVNTKNIELNVVFNASHSEMFFSRIVNGSFVIHHSELINGIWAPTQPIQMYPDSISISVACDPTITQDGNTMYFLGVDPKNYSNDVNPAALYRIPPDVYMSKKVHGKWQIASKVEAPVSTDHVESYPIVVADGSLYYLSIRSRNAHGRGIRRAQYLGSGKFDIPVDVSPAVVKNTGSTYINPNEEYLISSYGKGFRVSFKKNNKWQAPINIKLPYEDGWVYYCPYMSPDEKYFFFSRRYYGSDKKGWAGVTKGEVYWVSAATIFNLKSE